MAPTITAALMTYPSNGTSTPGYRASPEDDQRHPGLVVIQEWWGLEPHIKDLCERFARAGFAALVPDLFHAR